MSDFKMNVLVIDYETSGIDVRINKHQPISCGTKLWTRCEMKLIKLQVWDRVANRVAHRVANRVNYQVFAQVWNQVWVRNQVWGQVVNQVQNETRFNNQVNSHMSDQARKDRIEKISIAIAIIAGLSIMSYIIYKVYIL